MGSGAHAGEEQVNRRRAGPKWTSSAISVPTRSAVDALGGLGVDVFPRRGSLSEELRHSIKTVHGLRPARREPVSRIDHLNAQDVQVRPGENCSDSRGPTPGANQLLSLYRASFGVEMGSAPRAICGKTAVLGEGLPAAKQFPGAPELGGSDKGEHDERQAGSAE